MNWFAQHRTPQSLANCFTRWQTDAQAWLVKCWGVLRFNERLEPASELALEPDFAEVSLSNWRSHGQWKDSANRQRNYWTASTAPAEIIWQMVTDLASLATWHPLISSTNAPYGQTATPGLIYRVCSRYFPLSTQVFVERVQPGELLSIRLFPFPGLQERVTYRIVSTICGGTCVLYSITLSGWLSPIAWAMMKPHAVKVAAALVQAAEQETIQPTDSKQRRDRYNQQSDIFG
ncbi:MAG: hypothetical protein DCF25_10530 [Leptolyngbya foveolarum]|uniref:START domain-containing protein n=1 Tax=Leptolyngbya foveolarum TaxID=47253 RepID=A0A2W4W6Y4_9CYAN|nr:MAG: hypothetical protein DCF25_10530 [Leptolyngbya foveolarum]